MEPSPHLAERLGLLQQLREVVERQIGAARSMKVEELKDLNQRHTDLLFQLQVSMADHIGAKVEALTPAEQQVADELARLHQARQRLRKLTTSVVGLLDHISPHPRTSPSTYTAAGRISRLSR